MSLRVFFLCFLAFAALSSCSEDSLPGGDMGNENPSEPNMITGDIWEGSTITFSKADGADPNDEANQDRITNTVWLTRGNNGGQIFQKLEAIPSKILCQHDREFQKENWVSSVGKQGQVQEVLVDNEHSKLFEQELSAGLGKFIK